MNNRLMPARVNLGQHAETTMCHPMAQLKHHMNEAQLVSADTRFVMGYRLPSWQRPLVWTETQQVRFLESAWLGLNLGTYTYNRGQYGSPHDNLLIDGQQRLYSVERYLSDAFPVFGYKWSEVTDVDRRGFEFTVKFCCYITETEDEDYLRNYYDMMNFGGTPHTEDQRAARRTEE